jgi:hypothetical protein
MRLHILLLLVAGLVGCGSKAQLRGTPVSVSGKVSQSGQPLAGVVMVFQPLGDGHVREFLIGKDGSFKGELISGEYTYFVGRAIAPNGAQLLSKIPPAYLHADLSRTVAVEPDKQLAIALD